MAGVGTGHSCRKMSKCNDVVTAVVSIPKVVACRKYFDDCIIWKVVVLFRCGDMFVITFSSPSMNKPPAMGVFNRRFKYGGDSSSVQIIAVDE